MEISFPPPAGRRAASTGPPGRARAAPAQVSAPHAGERSAHARRPPAAPRSRGSTTGGSSGGSGGATTASSRRVLRALREENEHLGILDGIDPLF